VFQLLGIANTTDKAVISIDVGKNSHLLDPTELIIRTWGLTWDIEDYFGTKGY